MAGYETTDVPIIVRGDGCYLEDANGKRYLDALAGLFSVNIGYGYGDEVGEAAAAQMRELPFYTNWGYAHPRAIELASEVASLTPGELNRLFFVSGGSEAVESAWKLARQYYTARGEGRRWKAVSRHIAYHGTTMGALSINGIPQLRAPFEPLVPEVLHVRNTNRFHRPSDETEAQFTAVLLDELEHTIESTGPGTIAMVIMEPVQNAGGAFTPPEGYWRGVRELCDRYDILLCADEVITGFGRLGAWFGSELYDIRPDLITIAKGLSSSYAAIGAVVATDRVMEPFMHDTRMYSHGITFGGHPVQAAVALKNIEIMRRERIVEHVAETQDAFRATLEQLLELPIVGDVRGTGFFYAIELVKDKETRGSFDEVESGSFFALLGPSGCGKTTTLRMIGGFEQPTEGEIYLGDREMSGLPAYKRDVNTVFQSYALFPHLSVFENVAFGLRRRAVRGETLRGRVEEMLRIVGLGGLGKRKPRQLSGGQQQRVALARALVNKPQVLLLDEPLGALDLKLRKQMQLELKAIQHDVGITFVHVTHDQEEAMTMADRIAIMNAGKIEQLGTPTELYERPKTAFVAGFLGISNLLSGAISTPAAVRIHAGS